MAKDYQQIWDSVADAVDGAQTVQTLSAILADKEGQAFISHLDNKSAALCVEILDNVSYNLHLPSHLRPSRQGITKYNLGPAERQVFFVTLRRLAERHGLLPDRMRITEGVEVSDEVIASGGFAHLWSGTYKGHLVAVKTARVSARDNFAEIRKVSIKVGHPGRGLSTIPLQRYCKEVVLWSNLSHPNILKLVGVQEDVKERQFTMVSEWMSQGNIVEFIENNRANRLELVRGFTLPQISITKMRP